MTVWSHLSTIFNRRYALRTAGILAIFVALITTLIFSATSHAAAGVNQTLSFQGRLLNSNGAVAPDGYYNIQFKIYQDGSGTAAGNPDGSLKWTETYLNNGGNNGVEVKDGFFSVNLGSITPFGTSVDWNQDTLWLSMNVAGSSTSCSTFGAGTCTDDGEMLPMKRITSTPYSLNSGQLGGKTADQFLQLGQGAQTDNGSASSILLNKTGTGDIIQLQNNGTDAFDVSNTGDIVLGSNTSNKSITVAASGTNTNGSNLTISSGSGGGGSSNGGDLILQGGNANGDSGDTFPATSVLDAFNRANGALGSNWAGPSVGDDSNLIVSGDGIIGGGDWSGSAWNTPLSGSNTDIYTTVTTPPANGDITGLFVAPTPTSALDADGGGYELGISQGSGTSTWNLLKDNSTIYTAPSMPALAVGEKIGIRVLDGLITLWDQPSGESWTEVGSVSDSDIDITGHYIGLETNSSVAHFDDFGGGSFAPNSNAGGNVLIKSGAGSGSGTSGNVTLQGGSGTALTVDDSGVTVGNSGGGISTLNLDSGTSAPGSGVAGSMYYDSTLGEVQCYEANGWGNCSDSPNQFVSLSPTYANAVVHNTGTGTMTTDMCSDALNINDGSSSQPTICGTNETYNYYNWTSSEASNQTRSIYVTYKLPSNFKGFAPNSTSLMARTDSSDADASYEIYKNTATGLTACSSEMSVSTGAQTTWQEGDATDTDDPANCDFQPGDSIVFKVDLTAKNDANAYVSTLNFALK